MSRAEPTPLDELLAHHEWVSRLAQRMAGPAGEDIAQDAWMTVLRAPPDPSRPPRPWLAQVLRNLLRVRFREQQRRERRERGWGGEGPEHVEGIDQVYERMQLQRALTEEVMALEEPLRVVVVLRYVEGLDASQIAARLRSPAGTVRWRLKTALDQLRTAMDRRCHGERRAWIALLAPAALAPVTAPLITGALLVAHTKLKTSIVAVVAILLFALSGVFVYRLLRGPAGEGEGAGAIKARGPGQPTAAPLARLGEPAPVATVANAGSLAGIVEDSAGRPVAGATVLAGPSWTEASGPRQVPPAPLPVSSGNDGTFHVGGLRAGHYVATATKAGLGAARADAIAVAGGQAVRGVRLTIVSTKVGLSGRVVDSGGGGIPGARVLASRQEGKTPVEFAAIADEQGRYTLPLPVDGYEFEASANGYARTRFWSYLPLAMVREFRLHPASRITGRVVSRSDGAPLAGAQVWAHGPTGRVTVAEDDATFVLDLEPGSYTLGARSGPFFGTQPEPVALALAQALTDVEIRLDRGRIITGVVHDAGGRPVPDVGVIASIASPARTHSDAAGAFRLEGLPPMAVEVSATSPAGVARQRIDVTRADASMVKLVLAADARITGVVLGQDRRPVKGARVVVVTGTPPSTRNAVAFSDERGAFRFDQLLAGPLVVAAKHESQVVELPASTLEAGASKHVELVLTAGGSIAGTVRREDGQPAAGAQIFALATLGGYSQPRWTQPTAAAESGADGSYEIQGLPAGDVVVRALSQGDDPFSGMLGRHRRADTIPVALGPAERRTGIDLVLLKNDLKIHGRVVDGEGRGVAGAVLQAVADGSGSAGAQTRTLSQQDGQFVIDGLTTGPQTILAVHPDFADLRQDRVAAGATGVELRMQRPGTLAGVVVAGDKPAPEYSIVGRPVLGPNAAEHDLRLAWSRPPLRARVTQADGAFGIGGVSPGTYELIAYLPDKRSATLPSVTVAPGERKADLRLVIGAGATIRGRAIDYRTRRPVPGARAEGRGTALGQVTATADAEGIFSLEGLPAGRVVDFAIIPARNDYLTDCQHRRMPAEGGIVDIGDVPLFPGSNQTLGMRGAVATGLWFQSQEGKPAVYSVVPGSPGAEAGVHGGELVLAVDDVDVSKASSSVVEGLVASGTAPIKLTLLSRGQPLQVTVQRPAGGRAR